MIFREALNVHTAAGDGPLYLVDVLILVGAVAWMAVLAASAVRHSLTPETRRKHRALALACALYAVVLGATLVAIGLTPDPESEFLLAVYLALNFFVIPLSNVLFVAMLSYGILRSQLFDIELRLKIGLRQGTIGGAFVAVFFFVSEVGSNALSVQWGPIAGVGAAALLVFAMSPLQRAADRIASAALPNVRDTARYREDRGREIYRAAVESVSRDGVITEKERDVLATLQEQLGIPATLAREMEREAMAARAPV